MACRGRGAQGDTGIWRKSDAVRIAPACLEPMEPMESRSE